MPGKQGQTVDQPKVEKKPSQEQLNVEEQVHDLIVKIRGEHPGLVIGYTLNIEPANVVRYKSQHNTRPLGQ